MTQKLYIGAAYYPEHWPESRWPEDIKLMQAAGLNVVRMAEFAWSTMEPAPGQFNFDWLERSINLFAAAGIQVVLGTPTAAPPSWLMDEAPDMMAQEESGLRAQFGNRCHYCVTSPEFHSASQRIAAAMAERFGKHPNVIGWQIDNEFNRTCFCERCRGKFHEFLQRRFGTLENLNARWSTAYWSQTYFTWSRIPIPIGGHNPGLRLEFKHFITDSYRRFQKLQIDSIRPNIPENVWITHNYMGWFDGFDHYELSADLDLASWDWYVGKGHNNYTETDTHHNLTRGLKRRSWWLMETQPGNVNWTDTNNVLNQGEARAMAWQAVGHGAEAVLYWQWRSALGGQEQFHGTLVDQSGRPRPFYNEAQTLAADFAKTTGLLSGATIPAQIAMLNDYDSRWSIQWQPHQNKFDYVGTMIHYGRPLSRFNLPFDVLSPDEGPLAGYKLVIAPTLLMLDEGRVQRLEAFVAAGGHLVLTARSGMKDRYNALLPMRQPGPLTEMAGIEVEDYYALDVPVPVLGEGFSGESRIWAERLSPLNANVTVLARYGECNGWLDGQAAITSHPYGKGRVYYVGAALDEAAHEALTRQILAGIGETPIETPAGVQLCPLLSADGQPIQIIINHTRTPQTLTVLPGTDHITGQPVTGTLTLPAYGVAVLTQD